MIGFLYNAGASALLTGIYVATDEWWWLSCAIFGGFLALDSATNGDTR